MAKVEPIGKFILSYEGGFVNDPKDRGGATNKGVTIATWRKQGYDKDGDGDIDVDDLKLITEADALRILKNNYYNRWRADEINDQSVANMLVDWVWCSGKNGIVIPQRLVYAKPDGLVGPQTLRMVNSYNPKELFYMLLEAREKYLRKICENDPSQNRFLKGWLRRLNAIAYGELTLNTGKKLRF